MSEPQQDAGSRAVRPPWADENAEKAGTPYPRQRKPQRHLGPVVLWQSVSKGPSPWSPPSVYCTCGHDRDRHRRGGCWTGPLGEPVARSRSLIACLCSGWEAQP